ncbi:MAG: cysteine hydrolase family protein [Candidatus Hodarchaeales archaeon]|jgi:nicotinamidase-related amidase
MKGDLTLNNKALLIIDMQLGNFIGDDPIYKGEELLVKTADLISKFQSAAFPIIYIQNMGKVGDPDEPGSPGWHIHSQLVPPEKNLIVQKNTPDSFFNTNLAELLYSFHITHLYILGLQTEYCVDTTVRRAFSLGFKVTLVRDAHSTWDSSNLKAYQIIDHHNSVLGGWFADLKEIKDINL